MGAIARAPKPLLAGLRLLLAVISLAPAACTPRPLEPSAEAGWTIDPGADLNAFFDCLAAEGATLPDAHRGGPAPGFPENALAAFAHTLERAPAMLEIDVAQSADGVLFLLHDATLDRTTTGEGEAAARSWAEIRSLRLKDAEGRVTDFSPPRFADALRWAKSRTILKIDVKRSASYEGVAAEVRAAGAERRVVLVASTLAQARKLHRLLPEAMISLDLQSMSALNAAVAAGVPAERLIAFVGDGRPPQRLIESFAGRGVEVDYSALGRAGLDREIAASGDAERYAEIAAAGVDTLSTDRPVEVFAALASAGRAPREGRCGVRRPEGEALDSSP
jgi:glycerophosphoryl diester phosphodiesterase